MNNSTKIGQHSKLLCVYWDQEKLFNEKRESKISLDCPFKKTVQQDFVNLSLYQLKICLTGESNELPRIFSRMGFS